MNKEEYKINPQTEALRVAIQDFVRTGRELKIIIGACYSKRFGWISTEQSELDLLNKENWEYYFEPNQISVILAEHIWEHLTVDEGIAAATNCFEYLKPGGYVRVAVPDGLHPNPEYIEYVSPGDSGKSLEHKILYTYKSLSFVFESVGFAVGLLEYYDEDKNFIANPWVPGGGLIVRSKMFDPRNKNGSLNYTSIIIDAAKK